MKDPTKNDASRELVKERPPQQVSLPLEVPEELNERHKARLRKKLKKRAENARNLGASEGWSQSEIDYMVKFWETREVSDLDPRDPLTQSLVERYWRRA